MAAPMPFDAPVTTATLPVSLLIELSFLRGSVVSFTYMSETGNERCRRI
jgi:hypothetical protein